MSDLYAAIFAVPSFVLLLGGVQLGWWPGFAWIGAGIAAYGAIYFGFHDVIVHQRIPTRYRPKSKYMKRIVQAHRLHHVVVTKNGNVSFGFLVASRPENLKAEFNAAHGRVGWVSEHRSGRVRLEKSNPLGSNVPDMTQPVPLPPTDSTGEELRQAFRKAVKMRAHLRDRGQTRFEIEVTDLSLSGFRAETSFTLWPGTVVWLTLPGLAALEAVVAWRDKFKYGCAFAKPLHPAVFDHIVALSQR